MKEIRHSEGRFNYAPTEKVAKVRFLTPGLVSYSEMPNGGIELLRKETIDEALETVVDVPLTINHVTLEQSQDPDVAHGRCGQAYFNAEDGWYWCPTTVETNVAQQRLNAGDRPSCAYEVLEFGPGGVYQNIPYKREIKKIRFNHMAIVQRPRYGDAEFYINALLSTPMNFMKLIRKLTATQDGKSVETTQTLDLSSDSTVKIDGEDVRINTLAETYMKMTKFAVTAGQDDEIMIGEQPVKMNALIETYRAARKNDAEAKKKAEEDAKKEAEARENALKAEAEAKAKKDAEEAARKNGLNHFDTLKGAASNGVPVVTTGSDESLAAKLARGKARY